MYPEGIVTMWNRAAERIFGWSKQDVLGRPTPVVPEAKREEFHALRERVLRGESVTLMETQRQKKDGSLIEVSIATAPIYGANEEIRGIMVVYDDITERKRNEQARARLAAMVFEEKERRRIARELHDQIGQMLTALKLTLELAGRQPDVMSGGKLEIAQRSVEELIRQVHDMSLDLRPPMLDDLGLLPALLWLFQGCADQ